MISRVAAWIGRCGAAARPLTRCKRCPAAPACSTLFSPADDLYLVGGAVRDLLLGRTPRELDLVGDRRRRRGRRAPGRRGDRARSLRHRARARRRLPIRPRARPGRDLSAPRRAARGAPGDARGGPRPPRRDGQRDRAEPRRAPGGRRRRAGRPRGRGPARAARPLASPTIPRGCGGSRATPRGWASPSTTRPRAQAARADPDTVSGARLGAELRLALREPDPPAALAAVRALNAAFLPDGFDPAPAALPAALALLPAGGRADLVTLAACVARMDTRALLDWLGAMDFPAADRDLVAAASRASTGAPLHAARTNAEVARAARGAPLEAVALAGGENARRWLEDLRHVRLEIDGRDLLAAGDPGGPGARGPAAARAGPQARRRRRRARAGAGRARWRAERENLAAAVDSGGSRSSQGRPTAKEDANEVHAVDPPGLHAAAGHPRVGGAVAGGAGRRLRRLRGAQRDARRHARRPRRWPAPRRRRPCGCRTAGR